MIPFFIDDLFSLIIYGGLGLFIIYFSYIKKEKTDRSIVELIIILLVILFINVYFRLKKTDEFKVELLIISLILFVSGIFFGLKKTNR